MLKSENNPVVLWHGTHFQRLNQDIINNIKRPDLILMPFGHNKDNYFIVVAESYSAAWPLLCATLQEHMLSIAKMIRERQRKLINVDALTRSINLFRLSIEQEENIVLEPFVYKESTND